MSLKLLMLYFLENHVKKQTTDGSDLLVGAWYTNCYCNIRSLPGNGNAQEMRVHCG